MLNNFHITVRDLAARLDVAAEGDGSRVLAGIASLARARASDVAVVRSTKDAAAAQASGAGALIVPQDAAISGKPLIRVEDPKSALFRTLTIFHPPRRYPSDIHPTAQLGPGVMLGKEVFLGEHAVVRAGAVIGNRTAIEAGCFVGEGAVIGDDCRLHPGVTVYHAVKIGHRVVVHSGAVLGGDGFGYLQQNGQHCKIPHVGDVVIGDDVEIGANTTIDRAMLDSTIIERDVKIGNIVQISHDVMIGEHSIIVAQVGIAGGTTIGKHVVIAAQAVIIDHRTIGDHTKIGAQSGVTDNLPANTFVWGTPAQPTLHLKRQLVALRRLPSVLRTLARRGVLDDIGK